MRVRMPAWIDGLEGYNDGLVFYGYKDKFHLCYARSYVYPTITDDNVTFGLQAKAVTDTTWNNADSSFKSDMDTYAEAWNETQQPGREPFRNLSGINLFVKACFAAADLASFDLSTLTVDNFGGEAGDLLGSEDPTVGNLITVAGLPTCGLDLATLNSPIVAV